jgi:tRNA-Thr(GGU) m(6)t(6)A37 methyltransferase TsaA
LGIIGSFGKESHMELKPIGIIHSPFTEAAGTPIQPVYAKDAEGSVEIFPEFTEGLKDLDGFERIWLITYFHLAREPRMLVKPYMDDKLRGLFATRAPARPNPIGISCVRLLSIEDGTMQVAEVDILDGTPLLDIKPYSPRFDCFSVSRIGWLAKAREELFKADQRFFEK